MNLTKLFTTICLTLIAVSACSVQDDKSESTPRAGGAKAFSPTPDSSITAAQIADWLTSSQRLDSLSIVYEDSFAVEDAQKRLEYQKAFTAQQNRLCHQSGLRGGYREYMWIMGVLGNPRNKALRDSFDIKAL